MDNAKQSLQSEDLKQSLAADATNPQSTATQMTPQPIPTDEGGKKMIMFLVIGVIIVVLIVGGIYWMLSKQQTLTSNQQTATTPAPQTLTGLKDALDQELESINVSASEGDFKSVDQDLQSL